MVEVSPCTQAITWGFTPVRRFGDALERHHLAPFGIDGFDLAADPLDDLGQQQAEAARADHQDGRTRLDQGDQRRLDPGARGAVDQEGPAVFGHEDPAIERHGLVHIGGEFRIELPEQIRRHGAQEREDGH